VAKPDYQRPLRIFRNARPRCRTRGSHLVNLAIPTSLVPTLQVFSPANVIFAGIGVLLSVSILLDHSLEAIPNRSLQQAAKDVEASQDALADLFGSIEIFFRRLESYTTVPSTDAMTDIIVKIMIEVLDIFAIATKEMRQGRASGSLSAIYSYRLIYV
jgi:hypothetical protein